jgi:hypothetical protein
MSSTAAPVAFAGSALRGYRHVCASVVQPCLVLDTVVVLPRYDDPGICTYDANLLNAAIAVDILRLLHENPFFVPPRKLLQEVVGRSEAPRAYRG